MNSVNIIGHLTKDPERIETSGGTTITTLRVAINGRSDDDTVYTDVKTFGKQAAACDEYLAKGSKVAVSGRLAFDEWENEDKEKRSRLYVIGTVDFLDRKAEDEPDGD